MRKRQRDRANRKQQPYLVLEASEALGEAVHQVLLAEVGVVVVHPHPGEEVEQEEAVAAVQRMVLEPRLALPSFLQAVFLLLLCRHPTDRLMPAPASPLPVVFLLVLFQAVHENVYVIVEIMNST